jgi:putative MFS transporter
MTTAFLFPILLASIGTTSLLYILVVTSILGAIITWAFRIETTGVNLDEIGQKESEGAQNLSAMASRSAAK